MRRRRCAPAGAQRRRTVAPIIVNSSRAVLYASGEADDFEAAARRVALATRDMLNAARPRDGRPAALLSSIGAIATYHDAPSRSRTFLAAPNRRL